MEKLLHFFVFVFSTVIALVILVILNINLQNYVQTTLFDEGSRPDVIVFIGAVTLFIAAVITGAGIVTGLNKAFDIDFTK